MPKSKPKSSPDESSSIGWISTTDILLLVMVLTLAVALGWAHHGSLLETESTGHQAKLDELSEAQARIKQLNQQIEQTAQELETRKTALEKLEKIQAICEAALNVANNELAQKQAELEAAQKANEILLKEAALNKSLLAAAETQKTKMETLGKQVAALLSDNQRLIQERDKANNERDDFKKKNSTGYAAYRELEAAKKKLDIEHQDLVNRHNTLKVAHTDLDKKYQELVHTLKGNSIASDLLGLRGKMKRVVILLDTSSSMLNTFRDDTDNSGKPKTDHYKEFLPAREKRSRWDEIVQVVSVWLNLIPMEECVLITFDIDHQTYFPNLGRDSAISGAPEQERTRRSKLISHLKQIQIQPNRGTKTRTALEAAYKFQPDTIILFTDGAPNTGKEVGIVIEEAQAIVKNADPTIPINAIGVGDYFDQDISDFLRALADKTGGTFFGR